MPSNRPGKWVKQRHTWFLGRSQNYVQKNLARNEYKQACCDHLHVPYHDAGSIDHLLFLHREHIQFTRKEELGATY